MLHHLRMLIGALAAIALLGMICGEAFAWLLPQRLTDDDHWYVRMAAVCLYTRVFQFHLAVATIGLAAILFASRWWRTSTLAVVVALVLLTPYARDFAPKQPPKPTSPTIRLMSMNLYFLNRDEAAIMRAIDAADPDVIVLVEVTPWSLQNVIHKHLLQQYRLVNQPRKDEVGLVLSRLPYRIGDPALPGDGFERSPVLFDVGDTDVALYPVHLVSPGSASLVEHNRHQVAGYATIARAETRPMIIAGDCNFSQLTPNAIALHQAGLRTSHELVGFGLGDTWGPKWWPRLNRLPGVRIDHIWLSQQLTATTHTVGLDTGSDHRPVIADIGLAKRS